MSRQTSTIQRDRDAVLIPLSKLVPAGRRNPRRVKPERDAHRRLVASIRAHGLLQPLVVRPVVATGDDTAHGRPGAYRVTAGHRRLAALREVHRGDDAVRVPCVVRPADTDDAADAQALAENFAREPMHPLDEATAFAKLARDNGRDADAIAADFGVTPGYVRQRMKLADLSDAVQSAYRAREIDTATAEAFAAVPPDKQAAVWAEVGGRPQHAAHVRNVIANGWVDAAHALFDVSQLPDWTVSRDLFGDRVPGRAGGVPVRPVGGAGRRAAAVGRGRLGRGGRRVRRRRSGPALVHGRSPPRVRRGDHGQAGEAGRAAAGAGGPLRRPGRGQRPGRRQE